MVKMVVHRSFKWIYITVLACMLATVQLALTYVFIYEATSCGAVHVNPSWTDLINSETHTDLCHKCDELFIAFSYCANSSDACVMCEQSKNLIFFAETSNKTSFDGKQACSIETASHHHPEKTVLVYVRANKNCTENDLMKSVCSLENVKIQLVDIDNDEDFVSAGFKNFERDRLTKMPNRRLSHLSDLMRLVFMKKHGGFYFDLDIFVLRRIDLPFGIGHVLPDVLETSVMYLPPQSRLASVSLKTLNDTYTGKGTFLEAGPELIANVLKNFCPQIDFNDPHSNCMGITVYPKDYWFAIYWTENRLFYDQMESFGEILNKTKYSYGAHVWNHVSEKRQSSVLPGIQQGISLLASRNCPRVFPHFAGAQN